MMFVQLLWSNLFKHYCFCIHSNKNSYPKRFLILCNSICYMYTAHCAVACSLQPRLQTRHCIYITNRRGSYSQTFWICAIFMVKEFAHWNNRLLALTSYCYTRCLECRRCPVQKDVYQLPDLGVLGACHSTLFNGKQNYYWVQSLVAKIDVLSVKLSIIRSMYVSAHACSSQSEKTSNKKVH